MSVSPDLQPLTHYVTYSGRGPALLHRGPDLCAVARRPEETMGGFVTTRGGVITLANRDAEPCRECMGVTVCGGCLASIPLETLHARTSKGVRCLSCSPTCYYIVDDGTSIGTREVWPDGTVTRWITHTSAVVSR